jgi:hypothetical protein
LKESLVDKIICLKKSRNACLLAHNYQPGEVQDIADFVGDSLELSQNRSAHRRIGRKALGFPKLGVAGASKFAHSDP